MPVSRSNITDSLIVAVATVAIITNGGTGDDSKKNAAAVKPRATITHDNQAPVMRSARTSTSKAETVPNGTHEITAETASLATGNTTPSGKTACESVIKTKMFDLPSDWTVTCADKMDVNRMLGLTFASEKRIQISNKLDANMAELVYVHEIGHALASIDSYLKPHQREWFAQEVNRKFNGGKLTKRYPYMWDMTSDYRTNPKEVWANTFSTCNGYPPPDEFNFLTVSCSVLQQARDAKAGDVAVPGSDEWERAGLD